MSTSDRKLLRLAALAGVARVYRDAWGKRRDVTPETLRALLGTMGLAAARAGDVEASIAALEAEEWRVPLPPVVTSVIGQPAVVPVAVESGETGPVAWSLTLESGERQEGQRSAARLRVLAEKRPRRRVALALGAGLPLGYHRLQVTIGAAEAETTLIIAPKAAYLPPEMQRGGRVWGATAQLYALRSARNWGMGDFGDLAALGAGIGRAGGRTLGINPLHALFPAEPRHLSPYSPSSRLFLNPLYLDVEAIPDFAESKAAQEQLAAPAMQETLAAARRAEFVDHAAVAALKRPLFAELYRSFAERHLGLERDGSVSRRGAAFRAFQREGGPALAAFATFHVLHERMLAEGAGFSWQDWPAALRDAHSPEVARFAAENCGAVELHHYLQWEAERQLAAAAEKSRAAGLSVGLYRDLAVGVDPGGADAWSDPALMVTGASVGAPPDILNLKGQDWGLAPVNPVMLRRQTYAPFIGALRANMRHAGVLRIDHVMALMHLYWIPRGASPAEGAYVAYPFEDLRRVLALESLRQGCAVIGEDLGTVPEGFRDTMRKSGVLSYRLVLFERGKGGTFLPPGRYPDLATASFSTHDIATIKGFWLGRDLDWRRDLGLYPSAAAAEKDRRERRRDRRRLLDALVASRVLSAAAAKRLLPRAAAPVFAPELAEAIHRFLAKTKSRLALMQIEDAAGESEQANLPGTVHEHPNWRRKLAPALEEMLRDPDFARQAAAMRRAPSPGARFASAILSRDAGEGRNSPSSASRERVEPVAKRWEGEGRCVRGRRR